MKPDGYQFHQIKISTASRLVDEQTSAELRNLLAEHLDTSVEIATHEILGPAAELSDIVTWIKVVADAIDIVDAATFLGGVLAGPMSRVFKGLIQKSSPRSEASPPAVPVAISFSSNQDTDSIRFYFHGSPTNDELLNALAGIPEILAKLPEDAFSSPGGPPVFGYFFDFSQNRWRGTSFFESVQRGDVSYDQTWFPPEGLFAEKSSETSSESELPRRILEYQYDTAFRDDLADKVALFLHRSLGSNIVEELIDFVEMYKRVGNTSLPAGSLAHPFEIPPAAGTWEYFALLPLEEAKRLVTDIVLIWETSKLIRLSMSWLAERAQRAGSKPEWFLSQAAILSLVVAHQVETHGFQPKLEIAIEPRGKFAGYNHPDHPNSMIFYLITCASPLRKEVYLVDSLARVRRYLSKTPNGMQDQPLPDLLELRDLAAENEMVRTELHLFFGEPTVSSRPGNLEDQS